MCHDLNVPCVLPDTWYAVTHKTNASVTPVLFERHGLRQSLQSGELLQGRIT